MKIFWCHPNLRDYRKPFFEKLSEYHDIMFYFQREPIIKSNINFIISNKNKVYNRTITINDIYNLVKGIKNSEVFISSFILSTYSIVGIVISKIFKKKIIIWEESCIKRGEHHSFKSKCFNSIRKFMIKHTDSFFMLGKKQLNALLTYGVNIEKCFVSNEYTGHDYKYIVSKKVGFNIPKNTILYFGRFVEVKGVSFLIKAFALVSELMPENVTPGLNLLMVGEGPLLYEYKKLIRDLNIPNVSIEKPIYDIEQKKYLFENVEFAVIPSIVTKNGSREGGPIVVFEFLSAGLPILASNKLGSSIDYIINGINGYHFEQKNIQDLANKIIKLHNNIKKGHINRSMVRESFDKIPGFDNQVKKMNEALNYILS